MPSTSHFPQPSVAGQQKGIPVGGAPGRSWRCAGNECLNLPFRPIWLPTRYSGNGCNLADVRVVDHGWMLKITHHDWVPAGADALFRPAVKPAQVETTCTTPET